MSFQEMARDRIQPSPLNPRKSFDQAKLQELAGTMGNGVGIIEPLVVRPRPDLNCYELVAGERRWRAAELAGLAEVPVVVKELSDAQVLEIMVIENNQREDITPLEEAAGFKQLLKLGKLDVDQLADRLGRSRKYVYDRMKLLDLVPEARQLLERGLITAGHAILLARITPVQQQQAIAYERPSYGGDRSPLFEFEATLGDDEDEDDDRLVETLAGDPYRRVKAKSVRELEAWIARHCRFVPTSDVNMELFPETVRAIQQSRKVISITRDYVVNPDAKVDAAQRVYTERAWRRADGQEDSRECDRSVLGVVVVGPGYGEAFRVCVHKECDVHWKKERLAREKAARERVEGSAQQPAARRDTWEEQRKRDQEKEERARKAWAAATPAMVEACTAKAKALSADGSVKVVLTGRSDPTEADYKQAHDLLGGKRDAETVLRALALAGVIASINSNYSHARESFTRRAKQLLGVDVAPILKKVQTSAPKPAKPKAAAKGKVATKAVAKKVRKPKSKAA